MSHYQSLLSRSDPEVTLDFLERELVPDLTNKLNSGQFKKIRSLFGGDRIPENERNLTDARNRIALLIEFQTVIAMNQLLDEKRVEETFLANVVANRFPDLELRDHSGDLGLRFEMKCLQATAEEPSANFDALIKDIDWYRDYLLVWQWEWDEESLGINWDRSPSILGGYVFHASSLAKIRDFYWLHRPPSNVGDGVQGFDFRGAVTHVDGTGYKEEEGNLGKLLRLWGEEQSPNPNWSDLELRTLADYKDFFDEVPARGFATIARRFLDAENTVEVEHDGTQIGLRDDNAVFIFTPWISSSFGRRQREQLATPLETNQREVIEVDRKLRWRNWLSADGSERSAFQKPKKLPELFTGQAGN